MIITCPCNKKKFEVDASLIPDKGRNIQCGACGHIWFFKKDDQIQIKTIPVDYENKEVKYKEESSEIPKKDLKIKIDEVEKIDKIINKKSKALVEYKKSSFTFLKLLRYIIVFILSVGSLFLVLDTFKIPLSNFFPELELILFNFYEIFHDIFLFLKDLIK